MRSFFIDLYDDVDKCIVKRSMFVVFPICFWIGAYFNIIFQIAKMFDFTYNILIIFGEVQIVYFLIKFAILTCRESTVSTVTIRTTAVAVAIIIVCTARTR